LFVAVGNAVDYVDNPKTEIAEEIGGKNGALMITSVVTGVAYKATRTIDAKWGCTDSLHIPTTARHFSACKLALG